MSNEVKVALLAIVAIGLAYWGYNFIRGKNVLSSSNIYYIEYDNVDQLNISSPVLINGFQVGFVADIFMKPEDPQTLIVKIDLRKEIRIPPETLAILKDTGFMGGKAISLEYDNPCFEDGCAPSGSYLTGGRRGLLDSMVGEEAVADYMQVLKDGLKDVIDTLNKELLSEDAEGPLAESLRDLSGTLTNLKSTTGRLDGMLRESSGDINATLANIRSITDTLEAGNERIANILSNADRISADIAEADLKQTLKSVDQAIVRLNSTLESADQAVDGIAQVVDKIDNGEGTLGKMLNDEELYYRLTQLSVQTDSLVEDFQDRPYRYMPFKSRKKVKKFDRKDAAQEAELETVGSN